VSRSAIYRGALSHSRAGSVRNHFRYRCYFAALDLDELPELSRELRLFGYNRAAPFSIRDDDYIGGGQLRESLLATLAKEDVSAEVDRIELVTQLRVFGYVFNPVSFFLCYDREGLLSCAVAEVNNTYGQTHRYVLDGRNEVDTACGRAFETDKALYVSPFIDTNEVKYRWHFPLASAPRSTPKREVAMAVSRRGQRFFAAKLSGERVELSDKSLLTTFARYPFMTARIIGLIHWQALRLQALGLQYREPPVTS
jgi:DUF1365 family protein